MSWIWLSQDLVPLLAWRPRSALPAQCLRTTFITVACLLLARCGGEARLVPPAESTPSGTVSRAGVSAAIPAATAVTWQIGDVVWTNATDPITNAPLEPVASFPPDVLRIVAAVHVDALPAGSSIEAIWEYNDTSLDAFSTRLSLDGGSANLWVSFYIERDPEVDWPAGTYEVKISLNGSTKQEAAVRVEEGS